MISTTGLDDLGAITAISTNYRQQHGDLRRRQRRARSEAWFGGTAQVPVMVAEEDEGGCLGILSRWSDRCAYADTAEASLYVVAARARAILPPVRRARHPVVAACGDAHPCASWNDSGSARRRDARVGGSSVLLDVTAATVWCRTS
jgi:hypothetical protein